MQATGLSDIGKVRSQNQDSIFISTEPVGPLPNLFIVADGMGGHKAGEVASQQAVLLFTDYIKNHTAEPSDFLDLCASAAGYSNYGIYKQAQENEAFHGMGTTFSACFLQDDKCQIVHVGDSRIYMVWPEKLTTLTQDHSYVNEMLKAGQITPEEARVHPRRNVLTRVMGVDRSVEIDGYTRSLKEACAILLCSDGLFNMLTDDEMLNIIHTNNKLEERAHRLVSAANDAGGKDNISLIFIEL